jgi:cell division transport system permease protein
MLSARKKAAPSGASESRASLRHLLHNYTRHHRKSLKTSFIRLLQTPLQTLMTVLVIGIALAMPVGLYTAVENLTYLGGSIELNARMTVFLKTEVTDDGIASLITDLEQRPDVSAIVFVSADSALEDFRESSGLGDVLALLDHNPLPAALLVQPSQDVIDHPDLAAPLVDWVRNRSEVDDVSVDLGWLQKLHAYIDLGRRIALGLGLVLAVGVVLIMGNTIRLAIANRRDEIVVVKLIGATNGYVRRPFLYSGFWYGVVGGLFGWLLVWLGFAVLSGQVEQLTRLYQSSFTLAGPGLAKLSWSLLIGAGLGLLGAWIAVSTHLRHIEPE